MFENGGRERCCCGHHTVHCFALAPLLAASSVQLPDSQMLPRCCLPGYPSLPSCQLISCPATAPLPAGAAGLPGHGQHAPGGAASKPSSLPTPVVMPGLTCNSAGRVTRPRGPPHASLLHAPSGPAIGATGGVHILFQAPLFQPACPACQGASLFVERALCASQSQMSQPSVPQPLLAWGLTM